jgi:predicted nucleic acid-binding protein
VTRYLLDTNVFIQARNLHYGFDFCPAFWDWLIAQSLAQVVGSIDKVADELAAGDDDLGDWAKARGAAFFLPPDSRVVPALTRVSAWANEQTYERAAIATFLQVADYWLVAHALGHGCTVVTHEVPSDSIRKIKIPNACVGLTIPCINPYEMLRRERARFVLGPPPGLAA